MGAYERGFQEICNIALNKQIIMSFKMHSITQSQVVERYHPFFI